MKTLALLVLVGSAMFVHAAGSAPAPDAAALTQLLHEFLEGAARNDVAVHDRFWADELVYTRSVGQRLGKVEIMRSVKEDASAPKKEDEGTTKYAAEDVKVMQYGTTAVVAFRLVGTTTDKSGKTEVSNYFNTGTFVKRGGKWQAVAWQATKIPGETEKEKK